MKFFDESHCVDGGGLTGVRVGYVNKVLVVDLDALADDWQCPENQLFWCNERVYERLIGTLLNGEPETESFHHSDIIGVLDEQYLPDWAQECLEAIREPQPETGQIEMR